jgi:hypothetical protein
LQIYKVLEIEGFKKRVKDGVDVSFLGDWRSATKKAGCDTEQQSTALCHYPFPSKNKHRLIQKALLEHLHISSASPTPNSSLSINTKLVALHSLHSIDSLSSHHACML